MIVVKIRENRLTIEGHAGYAEPGKDIVCAGVTALTQTLIKSIEDLTEDKIKYDISPGRPIENLGIFQRKQVVDSFFVGILIADEFPENIRIV